MARRPIHVYLGSVEKRRNIADEEALRNQKTLHVSIDLATQRVSLPNRRHFKTGFIAGLRRLKNSSVNQITSEISLGYYGPAGKRPQVKLPIVRVEPLRLDSPEAQKVIAYTSAVLCLAHKKLRRAGTLKIVIDEDYIELLIAAAAQSPFKKNAVSLQEIPTKNLGSTWAKLIGAHKKVYWATLNK